MRRVLPAVLGLVVFVLGLRAGAQSGPASAARAGVAAPVGTTAHAPLPADLSRYWVVPASSPSRPAPTANSAALQFARGVRLIDAGDFSAGLPLVSTAALDRTALAPYRDYYTGVALLGLGRVNEATAVLATIGPGVQGYLRQVLPLRLAEAAIARQDPTGAVAVLERALRDMPTPSVDLLLMLGRALETTGDRDAAVKIYERLFYEFPLSDQATDADAALTRLRPRSAVMTPENVARDLARAEQLFEARRWAPARAAFAALAPVATGDNGDLVGLRLAECDFYLKRTRAAQTALQPYVKGGAREAEARYFHLTATRTLGDRATYVSLARALMADHPDSRWTEDALNNLATHYVGDDDDEADRVFRELAIRFPRGRYADRAAWKIGWQAYKKGQFTETAVTFEAAAVAFPRSDYRPSWLYWAARARDQLGNRSAAAALYRVVAGDYLNSYYGRLAMRVLTARGEAPVRSIVVTEPSDTQVPLVPNEAAIKALASVELYDQALEEVAFARRAWGDSSALQATTAWLRHRRGLQDQAPDRFADLRGAITIMRRAYPQFMAAGGERLPDDVLRIIFPLDYWPLIKKYSDTYGFDPYLMTALIAQESTFTADVRSSANAVGLMQLIPPTARRYAAKLGIRYSSGILTQPETNISLGMRYFKDLMDRFGGAHYALASYNAGESRIARWITERPGFEQDEFIDDIPFPETQNYVKRILGTADDYRRLYGERQPTMPLRAAE